MSYAYEESSRATRDDDRAGLTRRRERRMIELDEIGVEVQEIGRDFNFVNASEIDVARVDLMRKVARMKAIADQIREIDHELKELDR